MSTLNFPSLAQFLTSITGVAIPVVIACSGIIAVKIGFYAMEEFARSARRKSKRRFF